MSASRSFLVVLVTALTISAIGIGLFSAGAAASPSTGLATSTASAGTLGAAGHTTALGVGNAANAGSSRAAQVASILARARSSHIPTEAVSLPNFFAQPKISNGVVEPLGTTAPAPMGIGAYGIRNTTGTASAFSLKTLSWKGTITLNNINTFLLANDGAISTAGSENTFGVQLNAVTVNTTVGTSSNYSFWTQNVLYFNFPQPGYITFLDNIWNFSSPAVSLTSGTLYSYNGTPVYPEFYYDFGPSFPMTFPLSVQLYLNLSKTYIHGIGFSTVRFGYNVVNPTTGMSEENGVYDTVLFNSSLPGPKVPRSSYLIDGSQVTPTGFIPYDAEIMIGGPGGGTTTSVYGIQGSESLQYWSHHMGRYLNSPSAWNIGSETGETSEGIAETWTAPGTVQLSTGPSIPMPFWNATPGGNQGRATFAGTVSPSNAFVFFTPGAQFNVNTAAWAPTQTASHMSYVLPPGTYTVTTMLSDYAPTQMTATAHAGGYVALKSVLHRDYAWGVYTPLFAWNNGQLAALAYHGAGTQANPYVIFNNPAVGGLNPVFSEFNDYLFEVFPGVLFAGTTAYASLNHPSTMPVTYLPQYDAVLTALGLPMSNNLPFEIAFASHVSIWGAQGITGWFFYEDYGPSGLLPIANVVIWGGMDNLVGHNLFVSQGSALVLANVDPAAPTGNVVWGNTFVNSANLAPTMYPGNGFANGPPIAIFAFESGDLIYNNWVGTSITAYSPDVNMFFGFPQLNLENWNLSMVEPAHRAHFVNGYRLSGTIIPSAFQGGNYWADYVAGSPLPYNEFGFIQSGGDYFPLPITAYAVTFMLTGPHGDGLHWAVTLNGVTQSTWGSTIVFWETPGMYAYTVNVLHGSATIMPSSGTVTVGSHAVRVSLAAHS